MTSLNGATIIRGDTVPVSIIVKDSVTGNAINTTGYSAWFTVKRSKANADSAAIVTRTTAGNTLTNTEGTGTLSCQIDSSDTSGLPDYDVTLYYDWQVKAPATGTITTIESGSFTVTPDVTRATS